MKTRYAVMAGIVVALLLGGTGYLIHTNGIETGKTDKDKEWKLKWSERDWADEKSKSALEKAQRDEEWRRQTDVEEVVNHAEIEKQEALTAAADANDAADRLRAELRAIRKQLATSETGRVSEDASRRQTTAETARMLADMYEESDRQAGKVAEYADAAARAGAVCERTYDAVTRFVE